MESSPYLEYAPSMTETTTAKKANRITSRINKCMSYCTSNLSEECSIKPLEMRNRLKYTDVAILSKPTSVIRRISDGIGQYVKTQPSAYSDGQTEAEHDSAALAKTMCDSLEKITNDKEEFEKLKKHLRSKGVVTNNGVKELIPMIIDSNGRMDSHMRSRIHTNRKRNTLMFGGSVMMEKDKCGIKWNTQIASHSAPVLLY